LLNTGVRVLRSSYQDWLPASLLGLALLWVTFPILYALMQRWGHDSRYSHGYLVPLFSLYLLYARRRQLAAVARSCRPNWWGLPLLLAGLAIHAAGTYLFVDWFQAIALLPCLAGVIVLLGGWPAFRWAWPAVAFLAFMVPLPFSLEVGLAQPLQQLATKVSCYSLQTLGFAAYAEGTIIRFGEVRIGVVEACSGLSMLVLFFALSTAAAILVRRPLWERLLLVTSAVPIALVANIARIIVTALLHKAAGRELADLVFHTLAGYLMMPLALGLLAAELRLVSWLLPLREVEESLKLAKKSIVGWR
jgi:exosortase